MQHKRVRDIMVPVEDYPCIPDSMTIGDAVVEITVQILRKKHLSLPRVALVFDEEFVDLKGMLRRRDIMRGLEPRYLGSGPLKHQRRHFKVAVDPGLSELSFDHIIANLRKRSTRLVSDYMIPIKATVAADDHVMTAMAVLVEHNTSVLPVLDGKTVVGVVGSVDVLSEIALII